MSEEPYDPAAITEDAFLAGPERWDDWDGEDELLDIDDVFAKDFERILGEQRDCEPGSVEIEPDATHTPSYGNPGYGFVDVEAGLLLLDPTGRPVGGYIGCDVAVEETHKGKGLGAELVLEYAMRNGRLPTWDLDSAAYSRAGAAAHRAAHALARNRTVFEAKREALMSADRAREPSP